MFTALDAGRVPHALLEVDASLNVLERSRVHGAHTCPYGASTSRLQVTAESQFVDLGADSLDTARIPLYPCVSICNTPQYVTGLARLCMSHKHPVAQILAACDQASRMQLTAHPSEGNEVVLCITVPAWKENC